MMDGKTIFLKRYKENHKYQWGVFTSIIDWTIAVYLIIPGVVITAFLYREAWQSIGKFWSDLIPFSLLVALLLLFSMRGYFRTYVEEADLLYLLQHKNIFCTVKRYGFLSSLLHAAFGNAILFVLLLPVLIQNYKLTAMEVWLLYLALLAVNMLFMTANKLITRSLYKWLLYPLLFLVFLLVFTKASPLVYGSLGVLLFVFLVLFHLFRITNTNRWFYREVEIEDEERAKYVRIIFHFSQEVEKETVRTAKRPWILFPQSQRLFNKRSGANGLLELLLKSFLRNRRYVQSYYRMTAVTLAALFILPLWLKWVVYIAFIVFIASWAESIFRKMKDSPFFAVVPFAEDLHYEVLPRFRNWIALPAVTICGGLVVLLTVLVFIL